MKKIHAEFLASYFLVFFGTGSIVVNETMNNIIGHVGIAFSFGAIVAILIFLFGPISGAHMNPVVTGVMWLNRQLSGLQLLQYWTAQTLGALLASISLWVLFPDSKSLGVTSPSGTSAQSFLLEMLLTFFLLVAILIPTKKDTSFHGMIIGALIFLEALVAGPICGASMNPIRSLAPALVTGHLEYLWIYVSAPYLGGAMAWGYVHFFLPKT